MRRSSGAPPTHARSPACASGPTTPPGAAKTPARSTSQRWCADGQRKPAPAKQAPSNPSHPRSWAPAKPARASRADGRHPEPAEAHPAPLTDAQAHRLIQEAVAALQAAQSTWTEADLIRHLGERLPAQLGAMTAAQAAALLPTLARQALATEAVMLAAPEWPRVPDTLRRASGESLYTPHGAARYATSAQLTLEDRLLAHAQEQGAPRLDPATAARLLGAEQAHLEAQLQAQTTTEGAITEHTGSGLRLDQAAAAYHALTSARRAEVLAGPAGSGKTRTLAEMARLWREAGRGEVIGLTTSQTARNVLADAGVTHAYNTARFLGHLHGQREALGALPVERGSLLILDEASMMSLADMAAILALAHANDCKVVVTGDHEQLTAVEGGGGMMLLARRQGYVQLAEPQRFTHSWERDATLRLRAGDVTVLAVYEEHGRLRGGTAEEAVEQAYRGWLADHLDGKDTLLMARTEEQARELSRRARDDLIRYGLVADGPGHPPRPGRARQRRGPDHGPPQHPHHPGRRGRPGPGQPRRPADHPHHHRAPRPPRRSAPAHRPRPRHRPGLLVGAVPDTRPLPRAARHPRLRDHLATPRSAARPAPPTSWSTASATARDCTSP